MPFPYELYPKAKETHCLNLSEISVSRPPFPGCARTADGCLWGERDNNSYVSSHASDKVSGSDNKTYNYSEVFVDEVDPGHSDTCGQTCYVACSCNTSNGWYSSCQGSDCISVTDTRYAGQPNAASASRSLSDITSISASAAAAKSVLTTAAASGTNSGISASVSKYSSSAASANNGISTMASSATTCYKVNRFYDIITRTHFTIDSYRDREETWAAYSAIVNPEEIPTNNIEIKLYFTYINEEDDYVTADIYETEEAEDSIMSGAGSSYMSIYNKETKTYDELEQISKMEVFINGELAYTTNKAPFYTVNNAPKTLTFTYKGQNYNMIPEQSEEVYEHNCEDGYYETEPDDNFFTYEKKGNCYKVTGCKENGIISATEMPNARYSAYAQKPTPISAQGQTCYINWPEVVEIYVPLGYEGSCAIGYAYHMETPSQAGLYWVRKNGFSGTYYRKKFTDVISSFYFSGVYCNDELASVGINIECEIGYESNVGIDVEVAYNVSAKEGIAIADPMFTEYFCWAQNYGWQDDCTFNVYRAGWKSCTGSSSMVTIKACAGNICENIPVALENTSYPTASQRP